MAGRTISKELKAQIVSAYRQGEKMKDIAKLYGVSYPTVSKLVRASVNSSVSLVGIKKACPKCGKDKHEVGSYYCSHCGANIMTEDQKLSRELDNIAKTIRFCLPQAKESDREKIDNYVAVLKEAALRVGGEG
jgi:transposase-like protein